MRLFCGVDLGLEGGVAYLDEAGRVARLLHMPVFKDVHGKGSIDAVALHRLTDPDVVQEAPELVVLEYVHSFGQEARSSLFSFGKGTGTVLAVLRILKLPVEEVTPQAWKAEVLAGTKKDKAAAVAYCLARWPALAETLRKPRVGYHDGLADALCMAEFARRRVLGGLKP